MVSQSGRKWHGVARLRPHAEAARKVENRLPTTRVGPAVSMDNWTSLVEKGGKIKKVDKAVKLMSPGSR